MISLEEFLGKKITVLTGAGISAESGLKTFRDNGGLWENYKVEEIATPEAFIRDPAFVWDFYKMRFFATLETKPNLAHFALADLENKMSSDNFLLVTQNVDGLHERAGSKNIIEMHGSLFSCFCTDCLKKFDMKKIELNVKIPLCPVCGNFLRPDIVWFGEIPYKMDEIYERLKETDLLIVIGTSGKVYPAAQLLQIVYLQGGETLCINLEEPDNYMFVHYFIEGKAGEILPKLISKIK